MVWTGTHRIYVSVFRFQLRPPRGKIAQELLEISAETPGVRGPMLLAQPTTTTAISTKTRQGECSNYSPDRNRILAATAACVHRILELRNLMGYGKKPQHLGGKGTLTLPVNATVLRQIYGWASALGREGDIHCAPNKTRNHPETASPLRLNVKLWMCGFLRSLERAGKSHTSYTFFMARFPWFSTFYICIFKQQFWVLPQNYFRSEQQQPQHQRGTTMASRFSASVHRYGCGDSTSSCLCRKMEGGHKSRKRRRGQQSCYCLVGLDLQQCTQDECIRRWRLRWRMGGGGGSFLQGGFNKDSAFWKR